MLGQRQQRTDVHRQKFRLGDCLRQGLCVSIAEFVEESCADLRSGGDMGASWPASFEECINDCDTTQDCVDVSFVWPNACYKKNKLNSAVDNGSVWTARKKVTTSKDGVNPDPKAPAVKDVTCQDKASDGLKYKSKKGTFLIECGFDH